MCGLWTFCLLFLRILSTYMVISNADMAEMEILRERNKHWQVKELCPFPPALSKNEGLIGPNKRILRHRGASLGLLWVWWGRDQTDLTQHTPEGRKLGILVNAEPRGLRRPMFLMASCLHFPDSNFLHLLRASAEGQIWLRSKPHLMPRKTTVQAIFLSQQLWPIVKNVALWWEPRGNPWRSRSPRMCPSWQVLKHCRVNSVLNPCLWRWGKTPLALTHAHTSACFSL